MTKPFALPVLHSSITRYASGPSGQPNVVEAAKYREGKSITVTVHAVDSNTGVPLTAGAVAINGTVIGHPNVPFSYKAPRFHIKLVKGGDGPADGGPATVITVSCPGYPDAVIDN